jgi:GMP synthase-like glutamine amidotransferase
MKPVVIFRHARSEGAGYLGTFLEQNAIPWCEVRIDLGQTMPASAKEYSALVFMGGPMSVNDDLPWISSALNLIREAVAADIPVLGHCLGGQLMSKALGATVSKNPIKEIGWGDVTVTNHEVAKAWFGSIETFKSFHWHGETFSLPEGANHLLSSPYCQNQAWSMGKHLAFQTHIEIMPEMVQTWCEVGAVELSESAASPAVQQADVMQQDLPLHCFFLNKVAKQVYSVWIKGLA